MEQKKIERINALARLAKERALTAEEAAEREALRKEYIEDFRKGMKQQLDHTIVQYPDGRRVNLSQIKNTKQ